MENQRELFENNKITEALCQFSFKQHLDEEYYEKLKKLVIDKYQIAEEVPLLQFHFETETNSAQKTSVKGLRLFSENRDKVIQLNTNNISIHQIGNYQKREVFNEDILFLMKNFASENKSVEIGRIDLRTINVFNFDLAYDPTRYFTVALKYPDGYIRDSHYQFSLDQIYEPGKKIGVVRGVNTPDGSRMKFVLDLSYVTWFIDETVNAGDFEKIMDAIADGHNKLYSLFMSTITIEAKNLIK
jgi:uncharacterized protein (TIGR04255 family)